MSEEKEKQAENLEVNVEKPVEAQEQTPDQIAEQPAASPEKAPGTEVSPEDRKEVLDQIEEFGKGQGARAQASDVQARQKAREKEIEKVLADDLGEVYLNMPLDKQQEFKKEGEVTAQEINTLLSKAKIKVKKIVDLIRKWLSIIPGVNKYFLEQETKIKADEIVKMKRG